MKPLRSALVSLSLVAFASAAHAQSRDDVMVVFDGSNSMWGQIDGTAKIEIARNVMGNLLGDWTADRRVGLMAYGHRRRGDCTDIETLIAPAPGTADDIVARIRGITPTGKTPLTDAVEQAARDLSYTDRPATVVLISDGLESCGRDACALARELEKSGVDFTAHVVGFGLGNDADTASLACIAEETGGQYISANNASELGNALSTLGTAVAVAEPAPEPDPEPEPELPRITLTAPDTAVAGAGFLVGWSGIVKANDYVTIVPPDAADGDYGPYVTVADMIQGQIRAPYPAGRYEIRYVHNDTDTVLGSRPITLSEPSVSLDGPQSALTGAEFGVSWTGAVWADDFVTIVPVGADKGSYGSYVTIRDLTGGKLTAPAEAGLYELRYVLNLTNDTLASAPIEVVEAAVTLTAPDTALTGSEIKVAWSQSIARTDYVTVVPAGADDGSYTNYAVVRDNLEDRLVMPSEPGMYELRYVLKEGARTLARRPIELADGEVSLTAPETARTGEKFKVGWTGTINRKDYVTIVPAGADEGTFDNYVLVRDKSEERLQAPAGTGLYEIRYVLNEGRRTMARRPIEIVAPSVALTAPETALIGQQIEVAWTGTVAVQDYITIVPAGADEGDYGNNFQVRGNSEGRLRMPAEPGLYEIRYVLREGGRTMASAPIELSLPEVTISAPATAFVGERVRVSWTGTVNRSDYVTVVPAGAKEGTYTQTFQVRESGEDDLLMPAEPGFYEIRYVLSEGSRTMASTPIELSVAQVSLTGPDTALAGSRIKVGWSNAVNPNDYVTLVPAGSDEGEAGNQVRVRKNSEDMLAAPGTPGLYELRYVLRQGGRTLASQPMEIVEPEVTVTGPAEVRAGDSIRVSWTGTVDANDLISLAPMGAADKDMAAQIRTRKDSEGTIRAPVETGLYELRYVLNEGRRVLARQTIEVLGADAQLQSGATLSAPDTGTPGATISVGWSGGADSADQRVTLARAEQAIFTWISAVRITGEGPVEVTLPNEPGDYELRFLDVSGQQVMARKVITVQ